MQGDKLSQLGSFLKGLKPRQQTLLAGSVLIVGGALWAFVTLIGKAEYKTIYSGLTPPDAQAMAGRLAARNIPYELSSDATSLRVPANRIDAIRLEMAAEGLPQSGRLGFELFDKPNWAGSDFTEKVNYQRALEGELERTIQNMKEIEGVRVHLVLPRESLFTEREREAKAAVVVKLRRGGMAEDSVYAITHLVASAVDNLKAEDVTVVNSDGQVPLLARQKGLAASGAGGDDLGQALEKKLLATLSPVVGDERVRTTVMVEYDLSSSENRFETFDPNTVVVLTSQQSEEQSRGLAMAGIPGIATNVPAAKDPAAATATTAAGGSGESQTARSESTTYAVSKTVRHVIEPPGKIRRIATAVLIDDAREFADEDGQSVEQRRKRTPEEMQQIEGLVKAAIGFDEQRGDSLAVENISFETLPPEEILPPTPVERVMLVAERWTMLLRYLALALLFGVVYLLVLRPVKKQVLAALRQTPARLAAVPAQTLAGAGAEGARTLAAGKKEKEPIAPPDLDEGVLNSQQVTQLKRQLVEKVLREPSESGRLIQNWVRQNESRG